MDKNKEKIKFNISSEPKIWRISKLKGYNQFLFETDSSIEGLHSIVEDCFPEHKQHIYALVNGIEMKLS